MEVVYLRKFHKDLQSLPADIKEQIKTIIVSCKTASHPREIPSLKKLKGHSCAYRLRLGNYRIGLFIENGTVEFARIAHRKDIYRFFPE
ncbi:MAG: type II toxin-antitoxin system RelE/ParE family toxin [Prevotellaceae bacterium]|jgi:mRNA interferase RelE/StbE|nr:type II toxin-antitoxin system RelE/ParE family toxin [Prevotellaceae bacterium]